MAVSELTARRAIAAWELEHGDVVIGPNCTCRYWFRRDPVQPLLMSSRRVYSCEMHRPSTRAELSCAD